VVSAHTPITLRPLAPASSAALACGRSADRFGIPLIHCDAGAREGGPLKEARGTRAAIDALAELLYTADAEASRTLVAEGVPAERVHCVGNLLIDALQFAVREPVNATFGRRWSPKVEPVLPARGAYALGYVDDLRDPLEVLLGHKVGDDGLGDLSAANERARAPLS